LTNIDKKLFYKLREGKLTLDQVRARIDKEKFGVSYKVLDDLKDILDPKILKRNPKMSLNNSADKIKSMASYIDNPKVQSIHCERSLAPRTKPMQITDL
jgi:hypothetical protein